MALGITVVIGLGPVITRKSDSRRDKRIGGEVWMKKDYIASRTKVDSFNRSQAWVERARKLIKMGEGGSSSSNGKHKRELAPLTTTPWKPV